ncbi:MAG: hypothetical protein M1820_003233 [Bogoriella megaspora]|nr:MAG: hypothetical protein M1820_003233 [Bogoriella megaspora]
MAAPQNRAATPNSSSKATPTQIVEAITLTDVTNQILTNAQVLYPRESNLRVITAQTPSGLLYHSLLTADKPQPKEAVYPVQATKVVIKSQGAQERRGALMDLLMETERKVGKEILTKIK